MRKKVSGSPPRHQADFRDTVYHGELSKKHLAYQKDWYDEILYPSLEDKPLKFAISYRNQWMVEQADYVIAYITHEWGGAYQTYKHARKKKKEIFNLSENQCV